MSTVRSIAGLLQACSEHLLIETMPMRPPTSTCRVFALVIAAAWLIQPIAGYRPYPDPGPDIPRWQRFCVTRPRGRQCCPNRVDTCTVPILTTRCYCDDFCDRTISDCCPDFWSQCRGLPPQPFNSSTTPRPPPYTSQYCSQPLFFCRKNVIHKRRPPSSGQCPSQPVK